MSLGSKGRRRSRAAIDRRFTIARVGGDALRFAMRPKSILFLGFIGLLSLQGSPWCAIPAIIRTLRFVK